MHRTDPAASEVSIKRGAKAYRPAWIGACVGATTSARGGDGVDCDELIYVGRIGSPNVGDLPSRRSVRRALPCTTLVLLPRPWPAGPERVLPELGVTR